MVHSIFLGLFITLFVIISVLLILLILIQKGRGGGLASAFGGGGGNTAFGSKTGDVLTWATSIIFGVFLLLAVILNLMTRSGTPRATTAGDLPPIPNQQAPVQQPSRQPSAPAAPRDTSSGVPSPTPGVLQPSVPPLSLPTTVPVLKAPSTQPAAK